ncbi:MAG: Arc family DNA-binding protein [Pseudomonadota bacterium]
MAIQKEFKRTQVRFPPDLYKEIEKSAKKEGLSINSEIVRRLQQSFNINKDYITREEVAAIFREQRDEYLAIAAEAGERAAATRAEYEKMPHMIELRRQEAEQKKKEQGGQ